MNKRSKQPYTPRDDVQTVPEASHPLPPRDDGAASSDQYSLATILAIWASVTAPMGLLAWVVAPAIIPHTSLHPGFLERMSLGLVQRWVLSSLAATTILHLSVGLVVAAAFADRLDAQVGLLVIGAAFGVIAFVAALIIHQHRLVSPWLLLGLAPSVIGAFYVF